MTLEELQSRVGAWHIAEFGQCPNKRIARKLLEESAEFMVADDDGRHKEAADVLIVLMAWADRNGVNLIEEAAAKFKIVAARNQRERE